MQKIVERKTICIIYAGFLSKGGGVAQHIKQLRNALIEDGFDIITLSLEKIPWYLRYLPHLVQSMVNYICTPFGYFYRYRICSIIYRVIFQKINQTTKIDGLIFEDIFITFPMKIPAVAILHALQSDNLQHHRISTERIEEVKKLEGSMVSQIKVPIVTVSERYKESIIQDFVSLANLMPNLGVIHLGVNPADYIQPCENFNDYSCLKLVFAGHLEARKNVGFLIDVIETFLKKFDDKISLSIIGSGPDEELLKSLVKERLLTPYVEFIGRCSHEQVAKLLGNYHILVHPSLKESFGYILLEAKLAGLKTIVNEPLEVPDEFCDIRLRLSAQEWASSIYKLRSQLRSTDSPVEAAIIQRLAMEYSARRMARDILDYLRF